MEFALDPTMAANAAAQQDITAKRRAMESLDHVPDDAERRAKLRNACEGFEAIFIQKMWEQMRATLPKDGLMKSKEEEYWQSMYDQELGKSMASSGGIGLADMMMAQLDRNHQEMSDASRDSTMRRPQLEVRPAPLLPSPAKTGQAQAVPPTQPAHAATSAISATTAVPAMSIYEGEAPQPQAPTADDTGQSVSPNAMASVPGPTSGAAMPDAVRPLAEATPPSVRQTLDELTAMVSAQTSVRTEARPAQRAAAEQVDPRRTLQQMTGDAPFHAPRARSAAVSATQPSTHTAATLPETIPNAAPAPVITHITYQTNLPPSQRKAAPDLQRVSAPRQPLSSAGTPVPLRTQAEAVPGALPAPERTAPTERPAAVASTPGVASSEVASVENDILAGIRPRFIPTRYRTQSTMAATATAAATMPAPSAAGTSSLYAANRAGSANPASQAGGPALRGPEEVVEPVALGNPAPPAGSLSAPVSGDISSGFGWRLDPFTGQRAWHAGVDIKARPGEGVRAAMDGVVTFAGEHAELGHLVVVDHGNGLRTFYGHNQDIEVRAGQRVQAGTELAQAGASGRAAGTHVHFEVRRGELALNPEPLLRQQHIQMAEAR